MAVVTAELDKPKQEQNQEQIRNAHTRKTKEKEIYETKLNSNWRKNTFVTTISKEKKENID